MFKKLKEKKGFTLVELIVVLVILAILAALLIPALTGYIDRAKRKSIVAETRQVVMAAQTMADEEYAKSNDNGASSSIDLDENKVLKLAEVGGEITTLTVTGGKVATVVYTDGKKICTYKAELAESDDFSDGHYNVIDAKTSK